MRRPTKPAGLALGPCVLLAAFALFAAPALAQEAPAAPPPQPDVAALLANPNLEPIQRQQLELLQLINQRRAEAGLQPLLLDQRLVGSAMEHSQDMAAKRYCRHRGSDGSTARARMSRHGYPYNNWAGENIICSRRSPEAAMKWWLGSRPHRKNILHRSYTHIGIGIDPNGPYGPMWTLNFAAGANDTARPVVFDASSTSGEAGDPPEPTAQPTAEPTALPTAEPTAQPTTEPPTAEPTAAPAG